MPCGCEQPHLGAGLEVVKNVLRYNGGCEGGMKLEIRLLYDGWALLPCNFNAARRYPTCLLCTLPASRHSMPYSPPASTGRRAAVVVQRAGEGLRRQSNMGCVPGDA